ncbi:MAG: helix-turn-helix transcriptional regulator [Dorea sp.]
MHVESVHSNASYLSRIFKSEVGTSVITYITDLRIKKAKDLLEHSDLKTFEISDAVGIRADPAYFSVLFKKYTGMSPKSYRNKADSL